MRGAWCLSPTRTHVQLIEAYVQEPYFNGVGKLKPCNHVLVAAHALAQQGADKQVQTTENISHPLCYQYLTEYICVLAH